MGEARDTLGTGDTFLLYTDGVTEAMNPAHELYEEERLVALFESGKDSKPEELIEAAIADLKQFTTGAEQFDDITLLALQIPSEARDTDNVSFEYTMKNELTEVENVLLAFDKFSEKYSLPAAVCHDVKLAFDELLNNTISYGFNDDAEHEIRISIERLADRLDIKIVDDGTPFDPLLKETPDVETSMEERGIGGLGIYLVRNLMDDVSYQHQEGKNIITLVKSLSS